MGPLFFATPSIYSKMMAEYDDKGSVEMMARCASRFHRLGIVGAHDPFVDAATLRTYQEAESGGKFPFRLYAFILNQWADPLMAAGIRRGFGSEYVKVGAIKIFLDGGMSSRTAAVYKSYVYPPGAGRGILNYDQNGINREITKFDRAGYQISVHAQGKMLVERRDTLVRVASKPPLSFPIPNGAFYAFIKIETQKWRKDIGFVRAALKEGVVFVPGSGFGRQEDGVYFRTTLSP